MRYKIKQNVWHATCKAFVQKNQFEKNYTLLESIYIKDMI